MAANVPWNGVQMSENWNGCLILMCLSLLTLSLKPRKEAKIDYLISIYSDFSSTI